jgi:photosystem II stability/assembly factor-like uncharacterized protein
VGSLPATVGASLVLIDPMRPKRVYAADTATLYRSDDAGQTWKPASQGLSGAGLSALALDPRQPQRLYAATTAGALFRSDDGGEQWHALPPLVGNVTPGA